MSRRLGYKQVEASGILRLNHGTLQRQGGDRSPMTLEVVPNLTSTDGKRSKQLQNNATPSPSPVDE
eukprot:scaffold24778_cov67-Cyclotella_meneghiniana.AAC.11